MGKKVLGGFIRYTETLDCTDCTHCCDYMTFGVACGNMSSSERRRKVEYFKARGCHLQWVTRNKLVVTVYSPCPYATEESLCRVYSRRPEACRDYDCRDDEYLPPGGNYNKE